MGTQLNIKSDDAYALATRLAELTGENLTTAVTTAIRERLERAQRERDRLDRVARVKVLATDLRAHIQGPISSAEHDFLYGDDGLPL